MKLTWRTEWLQWLLLAGMFLLAGITWARAPDRIPVHWGISGHVDRYGGKFEGLLLPPLVGLAIYLLMVWIPRIDPARANYQAFAGAYTTLRLAVLALVAALDGMLQLVIRGHAVRVQTVVPLLIGALFLVVGHVLGKLHPNWFVGIRTPWTLSSRLAWERTHRAGSRLFVALGLLVMLVAVVRAAWAIWFVLGAALAGALSLVTYSYFAWRSDPKRAPFPGSLPR